MKQMELASDQTWVGPGGGPVAFLLPTQWLHLGITESEDSSGLNTAGSWCRNN